jgi:tRNA G37 N-methylase Trm5
MIIPLVLLLAAQDGPLPVASASLNPRAVELFERDWVLNQWAKRSFDANGDGVISVEEAQPAALKFKEIADGDRDGRVTPYEYDRARDFILARY